MGMGRSSVQGLPQEANPTFGEGGRTRSKCSLVQVAPSAVGRIKRGETVSFPGTRAKGQCRGIFRPNHPDSSSDTILSLWMIASPSRTNPSASFGGAAKPAFWPPRSAVGVQTCRLCRM
jgi:hypothetical protein